VYDILIAWKNEVVLRAKKELAQHFTPDEQGASALGVRSNTIGRSADPAGRDPEFQR
jgi:hypothetical protein